MMKRTFFERLFGTRLEQMEDRLARCKGELEAVDVVLKNGAGTHGHVDTAIRLKGEIRELECRIAREKQEP